MALSLVIDIKTGRLEVSLRYEIEFVKGKERLVMRVYDGYDPQRVEQVIYTTYKPDGTTEVNHGMAMYLDWSAIYTGGCMGIAMQMSNGWTPTRIPSEIMRIIPPDYLKQKVETYCSIDQYGARGAKSV